MSSLTFKKVIAGISSAAILMAQLLVVSPALAADNYQDVPASHWGYNDVHEANKLGFFEPATNFYPERNLNRAELAKLAYLLALKKGVVSGINTAGFAGMKDVSQSIWYYPFVATVVNAGLMGGYKDVQGNLTGYFGPGDLVTRAQAAKTLVNAGGLANYNTPVAPFTDNVSGSWYYDFINTAYNWSVLNGDAGKTTVRPDASIARVEMASMMLRAVTPKDRKNTNSNMNGTSNMNGNMNGNSNMNAIVKQGTLDWQIHSNVNSRVVTPIPKNTTKALYSIYRLTAGSSDIKIMSVTAKREGQGSRDDFEKVWLERAGSRVSNRASVNSDNQAVMNFSPAFVVPAGTSVDFELYAQMAGDANVYNSLSVLAPSDIVSSAETITGQFPAKGPTVQTSGFEVAELNFTSQGNNSTYNVGDLNVEVGRFTIAGDSNSDVTFMQASFKNEGSMDLSTDVSNCGLWNKSVNVASQVQATSDYLTFFLKGDVKIEDGKTETFSIRCDIFDADSSDETIELGVRFLEDMLFIETGTGFGATGDWAGDTMAEYTIKGGTLTIARAPTTPATQTVARSTEDVKALVARFGVGQPLTADGINVRLCSNLASETDVAAALDKLRLMVDGITIASTDLSVSDMQPSGFLGCPAGLTNAYDVTGLDNSITWSKDILMDVMVNVNTQATAGSRFAFVIDNQLFVGQSPEYANGNKVQPTDIVGQATGNAFTIGNSTLTIARNDGFSSPEDMVPGANDLLLGQWTLTNNDAADLTLHQIEFRQLSDAQVTGTALPSSFVTSCRIKGGLSGQAKQDLDSPKNITGTNVQFNQANVPLPKSKTFEIQLFCDVSSGAPLGNALGFQLNSLDAKDSQSLNALIVPALPFANFAYFEVLGGGSLTVSRHVDTPLGSFIPVCAQNVPVYTLRLRSEDDSTRITDLYLATVNDANQVTNAPDGRVSTYTLEWNGGSVNATPSNGIIHFNLGDNSNLIVPKDGNMDVKVNATFNSINNASNSGVQLTLATMPEVANGGVIDPGSVNYRTGTVDGIRALSESLGSELDNSAVMISGKSNTSAIVKTRATFANSSTQTTLVPGNGQEIYRFTVSADACGDVDLGRLTFTIGTQAAELRNISLYDSTDSSNALNSTQPNHLTNTTVDIEIDIDQLAPQSGEEIAKGTTRTYILKADFVATGGNTSHSVSTQIAEPTAAPFMKGTYADVEAANYNIIWSDQSEIGHGLTSPASADWMSGNFFNELKLDAVAKNYVN